MYPVFGGRPRIIRVPLHKRYDFEDDVPRYAEDMDVRRWFPFGMEQERLHRVPGLEGSLLTNYTIFWAKPKHTLVRNDCIATLGFGEHAGNILVVRHGRRVETAVANITSVERTLADILVAR